RNGCPEACEGADHDFPVWPGWPWLEAKQCKRRSNFKAKSWLLFQFNDLQAIGPVLKDPMSSGPTGD
ncbi:MAG: hypothetical protein Q8M96_05570, partial [Rubrivivax sp.]|nr:hypothetical protein [Rubrivivax sp.]